MPYKTGIVKDIITQFPQGSEWMRGKEVQVLDVWNEDGFPHGLCMFTHMGPSAKFRLPLSYIDFGPAPMNELDESPEQEPREIVGTKRSRAKPQVAKAQTSKAKKSGVKHS